MTDIDVLINIKILQTVESANIHWGMHFNSIYKNKKKSTLVCFKIKFKFRNEKKTQSHICMNNSI